jgi:hypothetical protein
MRAVGWSRRATAIMVAAQVVVFAVGCAVMAVRVHRESTYDPLQSASVFGATNPTHRYLGPFVPGDPAVQYMSPTAAGQPTRWVTLLRNTGEHPVTIDDITTVGMSGHTTWSPFALRPGSDVAGIPLPYIGFPAFLKPHAIMRIRAEVQTAGCPRPGGGHVDFQGLAIVWHALGYSHTTYLPNPELIRFCPPRG